MTDFERNKARVTAEYEALINRKNIVSDSYNGIYDRYVYPVLTAAHAPIIWKYDMNPETNPYFMERLGINAVLNSGAIYLNGKYYLVARVEGNDRKSFFAVAESDSPVDGFRFWDFPVQLPDTEPEETNVYDMRLTQHEDGWIYGVFCSESKDKTSNDLSAATAQAGIVRTKDLKTWERLPNLKSKSPQQRNVVLHPEFVDGKYAFYTRPQDDFIETGSGGGVCFGLCEDITNPVICTDEVVISPRQYHTITEVKNGAGAVPIKTPKGWIHIAHGVRNTAAGLRYVIYVFATDLKDPSKLIASPSGLFIAPHGSERVGDVSNVAFTNGAIVRENGDVYIYYASSDTRLHVAATTIDKLMDYTFNTPSDPLRSVDCVKQRCELIKKISNILTSNISSANRQLLLSVFLYTKTFFKSAISVHKYCTTHAGDVVLDVPWLFARRTIHYPHGMSTQICDKAKTLTLPETGRRRRRPLQLCYGLSAAKLLNPFTATFFIYPLAIVHNLWYN